MKVTIIGTLPPLKGISPYCLDLIKSLSKKAEIDFIGFNKLYPEFLYPGGTKIRDQTYKTPSLENTNIRNILTYYNPFSWFYAGFTARGDIIHAQWWSHVLAPIYFVILSISKARGKKIVITVHNVFPHENNNINRLLNKIILSFGDKFIVHSYKNKEIFLNMYNVPQENISVIPMGILEPTPIKGISKNEARDYLKISYDKKVMLHFGNIRDYKGLDILLESFKFIIEEIDNVLLIIAGKPWGNWNKYEEIIKKNCLESFIIKYLDFVPPFDVEYYFSASDVIVLPYKYFDSQSAVGALALPFKKPLMVTALGGLPDFVRDENAIAKPNDVISLARKIIRVLSDDELLKKLSKDSDELSRKYSWDNISEMTLNLYESP